MIWLFGWINWFINGLKAFVNDTDADDEDDDEDDKRMIWPTFYSGYK